MKPTSAMDNSESFNAAMPRLCKVKEIQLMSVLVDLQPPRAEHKLVIGVLTC